MRHTQVLLPTDLVCEGGVECLHAAPAAHTADGAAQGAQHRAVGHPQARGHLVLAQAETGILVEKQVYLPPSVHIIALHCNILHSWYLGYCTIILLMLSQVRKQEYKFRRFLAMHIIDNLDPDKYLCRHVCPEYAAAVHRAALCRAVPYVWLIHAATQDTAVLLHHVMLSSPRFPPGPQVPIT